MNKSDQPHPARRRGEPSAEEILASLNQPLPSSDESEKSVISALMQDPARLRNARQRIRPEAFYHAGNRTIYVEMLTMEEAGLPVDAIMLTNRLRDQSRLEAVGGPAAITELYMFVPSPAHYEHYMTDLIGRWKLRQAIHGYAKALHGIQAAFTEGRADTTAEGVRGSLNLAGQTVQAFLGDYAPAGETTATLKECLYEHMDYMDKLTARLMKGENPLIPTGIPTLDKACGGIGVDEYWLVTGPTKSGKSVLTGNIAVNAARRGVRTKVYTNEIGRRAYAGRILASASDRLDGSMDRHGLRERWQQDEYGKAMKMLIHSLGDLILIDNTAGKYVEDVVADMRAEAEQGTGLFVVDLIGKLRSRERFGSREQELAHISGSLCNATKTYGVPCIVVAQENDEGQVRESRSLAFDCEAWLRLRHIVQKQEKRRGFSEPEKVAEIVRDRRELVVEIARGFASGDKILCHFNGGRYLIREIEENERDWTD